MTTFVGTPSRAKDGQTSKDAGKNAASGKTHNSRWIDMTGWVFGMLTVEEDAGSDKGFAMWKCLCECGKVVTTRGNALRTGMAKSCGCNRMTNAIKAAKVSNRKHGLWGSPTYNTWQSMYARCYRKSHKSFKDYGGRGIEVCDRWKHSFDNFYADMGLRPEGKTLERTDNSKGYEPGNCVWETQRNQSRNRRSSRYLEMFGERKLVIEWAEDARCVPSYVTFQKRIEMGWTPEDALLRSVQRHSA